MMSNQNKLKFHQTVTFVTLFCGYTLYIWDRKSFAFNIPEIKATEGVDTEAIGGVISSLAVGYGIGKFLSGILVDTCSPKYLFSAGLMLCGSINLAFSATTSTSVYASLWFANGLFQGFGWPSCAKLIKSWYSPALFGTLWSLLSASINIASSTGPFFCNKVVEKYESWRYSMQAFGILSILFGAFVLLFIHDKPADYGFPTNDVEAIAKSNEATTNATKEEAKKKEGVKEKLTLSSSMLRIVTSPFIYVMSFGFLAILMCKGVVSDWGPLYLITEKNATRAMSSAFTGTVEMGGITGNIVSGMITDWIVYRSGQSQRGQPRNLFMIPCVAVLTLSMMLLRSYITDVPSQYFETMALGFVIGFTLYSVISLVGVMTIERSANDISGTSHALAALFGNVGLMLSGLPFTILVEKYSWPTAFFFIECSLALLAGVASMSQGMHCRIGDVKRKEE